MFQGVNLWAVLVSGFAYFVLGGLWYSPLLFVKPWMEGMKFSPEDREMKSGAMKAMLISGLMGLITAFVLGRVLYLAGITEMRWALHSALGLWFGFVFTLGLNSVLFERKPWKVFFINVGYPAVGFLIMAAILTAWK